MITSLLIVSFVTLVLYVLKKGSEKPAGFPPSLPRFPLVGSVPSLMWHDRKRDTLPYFARKLGPIFGFYLFQYPVVVISDAKLLREVFKQEASSDRFNVPPFDEIRFGSNGDSRGVITSSGAEWREQRRFALRKLRDVGFGKMTMNELIVGEAEKLVDHLAKDVGKPMSLSGKMNLSIVNALWVIMTGEHLALDDEKFLKIVNQFDRALKNTGGVEGSVAMWGIPWLTKLLDSSFRDFRETAEDIYALVQQVTDEHRKDFDPNNHRDFLDAFINEMEACKDPSSSFYEEMGMKSLKSTFLDLFLAGTETTSSSLLWTFLYLLKHPEVKARVHEELDRVGGKHRSITMDDEEALVFTQAVLLESMRITSLVPQAVPHMAKEEMNILNYTIPKGTMIMANLVHIHYDESHWKNPTDFDPSRFLSSDWSRVVHDDHLMPFSVGKRFCLGQTLAEKEFFLFFTNVMAKFDLAPDPNQPLPNTSLKEDQVRGPVRTTPLYNIILTKRSKT